MRTQSASRLALPDTPRHRTLPVLALFAGLTLAGLPDEVHGQAAGELRDYVDAYQEVWNTHDAAALAGLFAEDADMVMYSMPEARGRAAIEYWWRTYFEAQEPERRGRFDVTAARQLSPDVAILDVTSTTGGTAGGNELLVRRARGTWLLRRLAGGWVIEAMRGYPTENDEVELNPSAESAERLRPRIRAFVADYQETFNRHDADALTNFYLADADLVVRESAAVRGTRAIRDWWRAYFSQPRPYRALMIVERIRMIADDVALLNVIGTGAPADPEEPSRTARATWILTRVGGQWRIAALRVLPSEADRVIRASSR